MEGQRLFTNYYGYYQNTQSSIQMHQEQLRKVVKIEASEEETPDPVEEEVEAIKVEN